MNRGLLFWLVLILLWLIFAWWCCRNFLCGAIPAAVPAAATCDSSLQAKDGNNLNLKSTYNLRFLESSYKNLSYGGQIDDILRKTATYLQDNPDRSITVKGHYRGDEINNSILPNLGMARASTIKSLLTSLGAPSRQINLEADMSREICYAQDKRDEAIRTADTNYASLGGNNDRIDTLNNGISLAFGALASNDDRLKSIYDRLKADPMIVYFETNAERLNLDAQQRQDVADIAYYLDNVDGSSIEISGHTDNVGNRDYNVNLSGERAEFVKNYFSQNAGLSLAQMNAAGYGPDRPRASNDTAEGKSQNRRVEVSFN